MLGSYSYSYLASSILWSSLLLLCSYAYVLEDYPGIGKFCSLLMQFLSFYASLLPNRAVLGDDGWSSTSIFLFCVGKSDSRALFWVSNSTLGRETVMLVWLGETFFAESVYVSMDSLLIVYNTNVGTSCGMLAGSFSVFFFSGKVGLFVF